MSKVMAPDPDDRRSSSRGWAARAVAALITAGALALAVAWPPLSRAEGDLDANDVADAVAAQALARSLDRLIAARERTPLEACFYELASDTAASPVKKVIADLVDRRIPRADAEDLAREALLAVCTRHSARGIRELRPYFFKTVANLVRRQRRDSGIAARILGRFHDTCSLASEEAAEPEDVRGYLAAYQELSSGERDVLSLHFELGTHLRVAEALGISHAAARQRHSRAMEHLRQLVGVKCQ